MFFIVIICTFTNNTFEVSMNKKASLTVSYHNKNMIFEVAYLKNYLMLFRIIVKAFEIPRISMFWTFTMV